MSLDMRNIALQLKAFVERVDGLGRRAHDSHEFDLLHQIELLCQDVSMQFERAEAGRSLEESLECIQTARGMLAAEQRRFDLGDDYRELPVHWRQGLRQDLAALGARLTARMQQIRELIKLRDEGVQQPKEGKC